MESLKQCMPQHFLVEADGVVAGEDRRRQREKLISDGADHVVVRRQSFVQQPRDGQTVRVQGARVRHHVWQEARANLEPIDLIEVRIGADRSKVHDLVETVLQPSGLGIEENETHRTTPCLETTRQPVPHCGLTDPKLSGKRLDSRIVLDIQTGRTERGHQKLVRHQQFGGECVGLDF